MTKIKVLGSGCKRCQDTATIIKKTADSIDIQIELEKVTDAESIMNHGVLSTPAVVVNGSLVSQGEIPSEKIIRKWLGE